ncbi:CTB family bacteriocin [Nodularia harveyana UHCC-0300]|uniref:CTB family bacteriocin n=1 Tax=Nodularia harveyana UHCC-0300 TaxID=2974287 RepID=A0ABU5U8B6_9CYAN|nr:CTB family bacteriocin [Nodularia harveyana]MEA5579770.1 CTB family bacteriocin [Nodularia harveyana UHCC-0300]
MLNQLFTEISSEQQETVVGGFTINFGQTGFSGTEENTSTTTTSIPNGGSSTDSVTGNVVVTTEGFTANGFDLPDTFTFASLFGF